MSNLCSTNKNTYSISVVIATLGGDSLFRTIEQLNSGSITPNEILICIPEEDTFRTKNFLFHNVKVIKTSCRGQVAQRAIGLQQAQCHMVLQLDDDIFLDERAIEILALNLELLGKKTAVSPVLNDIETGNSVYEHELRKGIIGWFYNIYAYVVCSSSWGIKRMGTVTKAGNNYGVISSICGTKPFETQWLPGACVLCFKEDLILDEFYPLKGKAYCEDIIHSYLRRKKGIRHWIIPKACCSISTLIHENVEAINARRYYVELIRGSKWKFVLHCCFSKIKNLIKH